MTATIAAVLTLAVTGYALVIAAMYGLQRQLMYVPHTARPDRTEAGAGDMDAVTLYTADGLALNAWWKPPVPGRGTIVFFHGNAGHIGFRAGRIRPYLDAGYGGLLVDYRGYGGNPSRPTEAGLYADGRAALGFLASRGFASGRTVLFGESLGSGVAVQLAAEQADAGTPVAAVVLDAPFSSAADVAADHYKLLPARRLLKDRYDNAAKIGRIGSPLFIGHGDADGIVPQRLGRRLFAAAAEPKIGWWPEGAGHTDLDDFGMAERVLAFLATGFEAAAPAGLAPREGDDGGTEWFDADG